MSTIRANTVTDAAGTGSPNFPNGLSVASPTLTGTPTAPTAPVATNTTQIATTAFVLANAPKMGVLSYIAKGSIAAGAAVARSFTDDNVETLGKVELGQANGTWFEESMAVFSPAGYYSRGTTVALSSTTAVTMTQFNVNQQLNAIVTTVNPDGTFTNTAPQAGPASVNPWGGQNGEGAMHSLGANKFIIFYQQANYNTYAVVGTVSGTTVTFGSATAIDTTSNIFLTAATNDSNQALCITRPTAGQTKATALSISGTTITVGTPVTFYSGAPAYQGGNGRSLTYDSNANRYFFVGLPAAATQTAQGTVFSVTGTTITAGTTASIGPETMDGSGNAGNPIVMALYVPSISRIAVVLYNKITTVTISGLSFTRAAGTANVGILTSNLPVFLTYTGEFYYQSGKVSFNPTTYEPSIIGNSGSLASAGIYSRPAALANGYYAYYNGANTYVYSLWNSVRRFGISLDTVTNGQSVRVVSSPGIYEGGSNLTTLASYYVSKTGVVSLNDTTAGAYYGLAVSSTKLKV